LVVFNKYYWLFNIGIPLILVNLVVLGKNRFKEGMETKDTNGEKKDITGEKKDITGENKITSNNGQPAVIAPVDQPPTTEHPDTEIKNEKPDSFEVGRSKNKSKYNVDYAATIEDAYDELNNILGSDGIKNLTSDTQNLMKQQKQLTEAMTQIQPLMQTVGPLLDQAKSMMSNMQQAGGVDQLNKLAKQFKPSAVTKQ
jgi:mevalonate kinase